MGSTHSSRFENQCSDLPGRVVVHLFAPCRRLGSDPRELLVDLFLELVVAHDDH